MLAGLSSEGHNLLTSTRLYCAMPRTICEASPLRSDAPLRSAPFLPFRHRGDHDNSKWTTPCGRHCPALVRKTTDDEGMASFLWNPGFIVPPSHYEGVDYLLAQFRLCWRFSRCRNSTCANYQPVIGKNGVGSRHDNTDPPTRAALLFWRFN